MNFITNHKNLLITIIAGLFILLFVYAAINKLIEFEKFQMEIAQSPVLTDYANYVAVLIPSIEILISILFLFPKFYGIAFYSSYALMVMFTTYIIVILNFSDFVPCSCGGILEQLGWKEHLIFNILFVILSIIGVILTHPSNSNIQANE